MDISPKSVFFTLCLTSLLLDAGPVAAQQLPLADSWLDEVIQPALRSLPREKFDPKSKPRTSQPRTRPREQPKLGKPRLGLKLQFGVGIALGVPAPGLGGGGHGALGFYFDHIALLYALEAYGGETGGFFGHFIELEIYNQSRRRSMDSYFFVGGGLGSKLQSGMNLEEGENRVLGPAAVAGYGVNLFGGEAAFPRLYGSGNAHPYFGLHVRVPAMAWVTSEGAGIGVMATLVLEVAYQ